MSETFGGAAQANADTLGGRVDRLKLIMSEAGESLGAKMLPALTTFATFLLTQAVPAVIQIGGQVQAWAATMAGRLAPVIAQVGGFVTGTMVPALSNLGGILNRNRDVLAAVATGLAAAGAALVIYNAYTKVVAASTAAWNVVQKLLNGTLKANPVGLVITAIGLLAAGMAVAYNRSETFRGIVDKVADVLRGSVLPVLGNFAGILAGAVVTGVRTAINIVGTIIGKVIEFGGTVVDGARKVGEFAAAVRGKVGEVVGFITDLPSKITGALSGAGTMLVTIGQNIVSGLVSGLNSAKQWVISKIAEIADIIPDWIAKRLGIASPSKVTTYQGKMAGQGLADGVTSMRGKVSTAADKLAEKVVERIQAKLDKAKGVRDAITSMRDSISSSLTGDLFGGKGDEEGGSALDKFRAGLTAAKATADQVRASMAALIGTGVSGGFLEKLAASGNSELIIQLAGAPDVASLAATYEAVIKENDATGRLVAEEVIGTRLDTVNATIRELQAEERAARNEDKAQRQAERAEDKAERQKDRDERRKDREERRRERRAERPIVVYEAISAEATAREVARRQALAGAS